MQDSLTGHAAPGTSSRHSPANPSSTSTFLRTFAAVQGSKASSDEGDDQRKGEDAACSCEIFLSCKMQPNPCWILSWVMGCSSQVGVREGLRGRAGSQESACSSSLQALLCQTSGRCLTAKSERPKKGFHFIPEGWKCVAPPPSFCSVPQRLPWPGFETG